MKQINPLYLLASLVVVLFVTLFLLSGIKSDLNIAKSELDKTNAIANDLVSLKKSWGDKKRSKATLLKILNNSRVKNSGVEYRVSKSKVVIEAKNVASREFSYLLNKLFNAPLNVTSMKVRSLDRYHVSLYVEVSL